jgi:hypothetical protein
MEKVAFAIRQTLQAQEIALQAMTPRVVANQSKQGIAGRAEFEAQGLAWSETVVAQCKSNECSERFE